MGLPVNIIAGIIAGGPSNAAAVLSAASVGTEGASTFTGATVTTTVGNGTLYWVLVTDQGIATNAQIIAGTGGNIVAGKSGSQAVVGSGVQTISGAYASSLSGIYQIVFLHVATGAPASNQARASGGTVLISDTFTAANGTAMNNRAPSPVNVPTATWVTLGADTAMQIQSNKLVPTAGGASTYGDALVPGVYTGYSISFDVFWGDAGDFLQVLSRYQDSINYMISGYLFHGSSVGLQRVVTAAGVYQDVALPSNLQVGTTYHYDLEVKGYTMVESLTGGAYTEKTEVSRLHDPTFATKTGAGLRIANASIAPLSTIDNYVFKRWSPPVTEIWEKQPGPIFEVGAVGKWDAFWVAFQSVVWNPEENLYFAYYLGQASFGGVGGTGLATSPDGFVWTRVTVDAAISVTLSGNAWDENGVTLVAVWRASAGVWRAMVIGGTSGQYNMGTSTSTDGRSWTNAATTILTNTAAQWDYPYIIPGHTVVEVGGTFYLPYNGVTAVLPFSNYKNGLATAPAWNGPYTKHASNPTQIGIPDGEPFYTTTDWSWDLGVLEPFYVYDATKPYRWKCYYQGDTNDSVNQSAIGVMYSDQVVPTVWLRDLNNPILGPTPANAWESAWCETPIYHRLQSGVEVMYYAASNGLVTRPCQQEGYAIRRV